MNVHETFVAVATAPAAPQSPAAASAIDLLAARAAHREAGEVHLDIGAGLAPRAAELEARLGCRYVAVELEEGGLPAPLGWERHRLGPGGEGEMLDGLKAVLAGRPLCSITFLEGIEHLPAARSFLKAVADLARAASAFVVVGAANVSHHRVALELICGRWEPPGEGAAHGRLCLYDRHRLADTLDAAGLHVVERADVTRETIPSPTGDHPGLQSGTPLYGLLHDIALKADGAADVERFTWLCLSGRPIERASVEAEAREAARPFLSVITRTQGRRLHTLTETLLCLAGQDDADFEVLVMGHRLDADARRAVLRVIEDTPDWLRARIRFVAVEEGGRSHPLNVGFAAARGHYISILDDDDIPFGNWVEVFRALAKAQPGRVLRAACVRQEVVNAKVSGRAGLRAEGTPERFYSGRFDFLDHFRRNSSPPVGLAFPRGAFHALGLRFDEALETAEDWDFLMQAVAACGVASSPEITSVYRWWVGEESSRTVQSEQRWRRDEATLMRRQDETFFILPKEEVAEIRALARERGLARIDLGHRILDHAEALAAIAAQLPPDLRALLRKGARGRIWTLKVKQLFWIWSARKRRRYRARIRAYRALIAGLK